MKTRVLLIAARARRETARAATFALERSYYQLSRVHVAHPSAILMMLATVAPGVYGVDGRGIRFRRVTAP